MTRRKQDSSLPFPVEREPVGTVEKAAAADLRELRELGMLSTGTGALCAAYRRAARDADRAERKRDPWASASAMRELRALRLEIAPTASPLTGDTLSELLDDIARVVAESREQQQ